ncbi:MAG: hypothetical protein ACM3SS_02735 [Rhodospirillaceae bacterium]
MDAHKGGNYSQAQKIFEQCAANGDSNCMNALGYMYDHRQIYDARPREQALRWFILSARHGNNAARANLTRMGVPIPPPDLEKQPSPIQEAYMLDSLHGLGDAIGSALGRMAR